MATTLDELSALDPEARWARLEALAADPTVEGDVAGELYQRLGDDRLAAGRFYTPGPLVDLVTALAAHARGAEPVHRVLDPAVGSGRFLTAAHRTWPGARLMGVDRDARAVELARLSLGRIGRVALRRGDALDPATLGDLRVDVVLGNPPYGRRTPDDHIRRHVAPYAFPAWWYAGGVPASERNRGKLADLVPWFMGLALRHCTDNGVVALLTSNAWLSIPTWRYLRRYLLERTTVEWVVDFDRPSTRASMFQPDAGIATCVVVLRKATPPPDHRVRFVDLSRQASVRARYDAIARCDWAPGGRYHRDIESWTVRPTDDLPTTAVRQSTFLERRDHILRTTPHRARLATMESTWVPLSQQVFTQPGVDPGDLRHLVAPDPVRLEAQVLRLLDGQLEGLGKTARAWIGRGLESGLLGDWDPRRVVPFVYQKDLLPWGVRRTCVTYLHPHLLWRARLPDDGDPRAPVRARHKLLVVERRERGELVAVVVGDHAVAQHGGRLITVPASDRVPVDVLHALCALIHSEPVQLLYRERAQGDKDVLLPPLRTVDVADLAARSRRAHRAAATFLAMEGGR